MRIIIVILYAPMHRIADRLKPCLNELVNRFHPESIMPLGSYSYENPDKHSDAELLIVKENMGSSISEMRNILKAWSDLRWSGCPL